MNGNMLLIGYIIRPVHQIQPIFLEIPTETRTRGQKEKHTVKYSLAQKYLDSDATVKM